MRFEIYASATLLAIQVLLPRPAPRPQPPVAPVAPVAYVEQRAERNNAAEAAHLEALWLANNAGYHAPACTQYDPLAILDANVDSTPGLEHVIGNRRYGVAMFTEDGVLIARSAPVGCVHERKGDQSLSLSSNGGRLVMYTRDLLDDGEHLSAYILTATEDVLDGFAMDLGGDRGDRQVTGAMYFPGGGELEIKHHGRQRAEDGSWEAVDDHCTWDLATRSSSCRTRAAARR